MIDIVDNFLPKEEFESIQNLMLQSNFPWYYNNGIVASEENNPTDPYFQFVHLFYKANKINSDFYPLLINFLIKLDIKALVRIKANLTVKTKEHEKHGYHNDSNNNLTSIYYVNTNNGYTEFEDGKIIKSIGNRMVTFDSNLRHQSVSATDQKIRVVINFNYFKHDNDTPAYA